MLSRNDIKNDMEKIKKVFQKLIKYWPVFVGLILIVIGLGVFQVLKLDSKSEDNPGITTSIITTGDIRLSAFGSGTLIAAEAVSVGFDYGGVVEEILVEVGDLVQEGDILAVLYDEDLRDEFSGQEANLREITSDAAIAAAALELAEAQKDVLTAESTLSFYLSPYVFKSEIRLMEAKEELSSAIMGAEENPSQETEQRLVEAQAAEAHAEMSLALNYETYYQEYVPDFFNFPWRDRFGVWHDYFDPPSELEVAEVWAELAAAEARVEEAEFYLVALTEGSIPDKAYGSMITALEKAAENLAEAKEQLDAARLDAPMDGLIVDINLVEEESIGTKKIITIARLDPITLETSFDEGDWSMVQEGNPVEVVFDAIPEITYHGEIVFVEPTLQSRGNSTVVSALVELDVTETEWSGLPLSSGANIEVIAGEIENAVLLPIQGLQEDTGDEGSVLVESGGDFKLKEVELGLRDVLYVEVTSGLSAGEVVLVGEFD